MKVKYMGADGGGATFLARAARNGDDLEDNTFLVGDLHIPGPGRRDLHVPREGKPLPTPVEGRAASTFSPS